MIRRYNQSKKSKTLRIHNRLNNINLPKQYSPRYKLQNCIWNFTLGDPDDKPSVPHAHAEGLGYRLNAWTRDIYPAGNERKKSIGKLKRKELQKLHSDPKFISFANKQIQWYKETYPHIHFYIPDSFMCNKVYLRTIDNHAKNENYSFIGTAIINK